eukprot:13295-Heterococcus_DN1.PRE.3
MERYNLSAMIGKEQLCVHTAPVPVLSAAVPVRAFTVASSLARIVSAPPAAAPAVVPAVVVTSLVTSA